MPTSYKPKPIIQTLLSYLDIHPDFKADLERALKEAKTKGIKEFDDIKTLDDYVEFCNNLLEWVPMEDATATAVLNHFCMFYFILDLLPSKYQTPIVPGGGWTWLSQWLIDYAQAVGKWMDDPKSISEESLKTFYLNKQPPPHGYHMEDYFQPLGGWKTFNEFFARRIDAKVRPIYEPEDSRAIVSPADSTFLGAFDIKPDDTTDFITAKGVPWSISELLQDTEYGERFKGGKFTHAFLSTTDYHRQHAPVSGTVVEAKVIPGSCYLEVVVVPGSDGNKLKMHRDLRRLDPMRRDQTRVSSGGKLDAPDRPGYQFLQARGLIVIDNKELGLVAVMPIGMAQVSSVVLSPNVKVGNVLKKGDEIAHFKFGGSDIVMVFEAKARVDFTKTVKNQWYKIGELFARANPKNVKNQWYKVGGLR